ncbi:peptide deformylase [Sulfurimonas sp. MAG313]|nr:peptide deformylase [Sulfurimonas sp. MAG313]MDF1881594.1 peptide deformylase [Sulfurimonas sp. MAG313]
MKLPVVVYPDKKLKLISKPVESFNADLHTFLDNMYETMMQSNGIGLAAIQVAKAERIMLLCIPDEEGEQNKDDLLEIINPKISNEQGTIVYQEGCLSVPSFYEDIERYESLTLDFQDRHGKKISIQAEGLLSVAIQHEIDHLDGKLFIERLPYGRRKKFEKEYKKLLKQKKNPASD